MSAPYPPLRRGDPCPACHSEPVGDYRDPNPDNRDTAGWPLHYPDCDHPQVATQQQEA